MITKMAAIIPPTPKRILPDANAHAENTSASVVSSVTKIRWNAFSDILVHGRSGREIAHRIPRQPEQTENEKNGKTQNGINHFLFRKQVH